MHNIHTYTPTVLHEYTHMYRSLMMMGIASLPSILSLTRDSIALISATAAATTHRELILTQKRRTGRQTLKIYIHIYIYIYFFIVFLFLVIISEIQEFSILVFLFSSSSSASAAASKNRLCLVFLVSSAGFRVQ